MNGVTLNERTDEAATEFPRDDLEINALIRCAPWFTVPPLPLYIQTVKHDCRRMLVTFLVLLTCKKPWKRVNSSRSILGQGYNIEGQGHWLPYLLK